MGADPVVLPVLADYALAEPWGLTARIANLSDDLVHADSLSVIELNR
jgi:hypothetical protein